MPAQLPVWSKDSAALLAQFLGTGAGQLFMEHLAASIPASALPGADISQVALEARRIEGFIAAIRKVQELSLPPAEAPKSSRPNLPDLDDEAAWADEPKSTAPANPPAE